MEIFDFERDMDGFLENKIAVNCITEEDANYFLKILKDKCDLKWSNGDNISEYNGWQFYEEKISYLILNQYKAGLYYRLIDYAHEKGYKILQYNNSNQNLNIKENIEENVKQTKKRKIFIIEDF